MNNRLPKDILILAEKKQSLYLPALVKPVFTSNQDLQHSKRFSLSKNVVISGCCFVNIDLNYWLDVQFFINKIKEQGIVITCKEQGCSLGSLLLEYSCPPSISKDSVKVLSWYSPEELNQLQNKL